MEDTCDAKGIFVEKGSFVKKGTELLQAKPFVFTLSTKFRKERCDTCLKKCEIFRCAGCQYVYYCSRNCQRQSWRIHKVECPNFKRISPRELPDAGRMLAKLIIKLHNGGGQERGYIYKNKYRTFQDLMSHNSNIQKDRKKLEHAVTLTVVLKEFLPFSLLPEPQEFLEMFGKLSINAFAIVDRDMLSIGTGIYLGASIMDHSCRPNAFIVFDGTRLKVSTLKDIPSFDWSKVTISYIDLLNTTDDRRTELLNTYYFWCECERCTNPELTTTGAVCPNKSCTQLCSPGETSCNSCGQELSKLFWEEFELITNMSLRYIEKTEDSSLLDAYRMCLNKQEGLLHPLNVVHARILERAFTTCVNLHLNEEVMKWGTNLLKIYEYYCGDGHPLTTSTQLLLEIVKTDIPAFSNTTIKKDSFIPNSLLKNV